MATSCAKACQATSSLTVLILLMLINLYPGLWFHGFFPADDRDPSGPFLPEVDHHTVLRVTLSAGIGSFEFWSRSFETKHHSTIFSPLSAPRRLHRRTDALLRPCRATRLDEVYQATSPCLELLLRNRIPCDAAVCGGRAKIVKMLSGLVQ